MTTRRKLLIALGASALAYAGVVRAQSSASKPVRVGILVDFTQTDYRAIGQPFVETLRALGWVEGRNIIFDPVFADNDVARLPVLAEAMVARNPDLIFAPTGSAPYAAVAKTRTIPIVFAAQANLVERGLVQSLAHPGGNVTGVHNIGWELAGKRLQLLKQALPKMTRVGVLRHSSAAASEQKLIEQAAVTLGISVIPVLVKQGDDLEGTFAALPKHRVDALLVTHNALFIITERRRILALAEKQRLPVAAPRSEFVDGGALMSYSSLLADQYRRAAQLADKILKGAKPADLPVEQPTKFELVINLKTAKVLGITIPQSILGIADRVIE